MDPFELQVVTPERVVFRGQTTSVVVPAEDGYLGVWAHHAPLLAALGKGTLTVRTPEGTRSWELRGGLLEVHSNMASVLADEVAEEV
jgi:F-type H+-transporting ATPase subunit epsilon